MRIWLRFTPTLELLPFLEFPPSSVLPVCRQAGLKGGGNEIIPFLGYEKRVD